MTTPCASQSLDPWLNDVSLYHSLKSDRLCLKATGMLATQMYLMVCFFIRAAAGRCTPCAAGTYPAPGDIMIHVELNQAQTFKNGESISEGHHLLIPVWFMAQTFAL